MWILGADTRFFIVHVTNSYCHGGISKQNVFLFFFSSTENCKVSLLAEGWWSKKKSTWKRNFFMWTFFFFYISDKIKPGGRLITVCLSVCVCHLGRLILNISSHSPGRFTSITGCAVDWSPFSATCQIITTSQETLNSTFSNSLWFLKIIQYIWMFSFVVVGIFNQL